MDLKNLLPLLLPKAIAWCEEVSAAVVQAGVALRDVAIADARSVGVLSPDNIRVLVVDEFPQPSDPLLARAARSIEFLGPSTAGLTLGYAILIRRGGLSRRLLSHECRHVSQFERAGSLSSFLTAYLAELVSSGYDACSFEVDARAHELPNADRRWRPL